ncbi:hypothetical protein JCM13580A_00720 [Streptomyces drozdowiczii]
MSSSDLASGSSFPGAYGEHTQSLIGRPPGSGRETGQGARTHTGPSKDSRESLENRLRNA